MEIPFSPRSYVFNGLDILRKPLILYIYNAVSKSHNWLNDCIRNALSEQKVSYLHIYSEDIEDLYTSLDESACFYILLYYKNRKYFSNEISDFDLVHRIIDLRNDCVHKIIYARNAEIYLAQLSELMENIDPDCAETISIFRQQMINELFAKKNIRASKEDLIEFLERKIWTPSRKILEEDNSIEKNKKAEFINSFENSLKKIKKKFNSAGEIYTWFNACLSPKIKSGTEFYEELKKFHLPTFEDYRLEFWKLCYGE